MGTLQKLQNSIQTLIIFWPVYPIHTNSLFWVIFVGLPFCHFPPSNASIRGKDSKIQLIFHLNILVFQTNGKQPDSFPVLSRFCNGLCKANRQLNHTASGIVSDKKVMKAARDQQLELTLKQWSRKLRSPLLSWIHLADVHQNVVFEMAKKSLEGACD